MKCSFKKIIPGFHDYHNYTYYTESHHHSIYVASKSHDAICHLKEQHATLQLSISEKLAVVHLQGRCTRRSTWKRPSICKDLVTVLPLARLLAQHGTALMNNAWGHLPPLNYRSVEAQHMGTAQQC